MALLNPKLQGKHKGNRRTTKQGFDYTKNEVQ